VTAADAAEEDVTGKSILSCAVLRGEAAYQQFVMRKQEAEGGMMTQAELDSIARKIRAKGLHSSWDELLEFSENVVGSLVNAYQALLKSPALSEKATLSNRNDAQKVVRDKLAMAITALTSEAQVARWESEARVENREHETSGFKEKHSQA
jgi:hypothetical protein